MLVVLPIISLLVGAFALHAVSLIRRDLARYLALASAIIAMISALKISLEAIYGKIIVYPLGGWKAPYGIVLVIDDVNAALLLFSSILIVFLVAYAILSVKDGKYLTLLLLFSASSLGVLETGDLFNMYVFFEILSISSYALVAFSKSKSSLKASISYAISGSLGTTFILLGIAMTYASYGTLNLAHLAKITEHNCLYLAITFFLVGFGIKALIYPLHVWKVSALSYALPSTSAALAGITTNIGLYCIFRILTIFNALRTFSLFLISIGAIGIILSAILASMQKKLSMLLAYSCMCQASYVLLCFGIIPFVKESIVAAVFHMINSAFAEACLFMILGMVGNDMSKLSIKNSVVKIPFILASMSIAGMPGLVGFVSKLLIYEVTFKFNALLTIVALAGSAISFLYFGRILCFSLHSRREEVRILSTIPINTLALFCLIFGIYPEPLYDIAEKSLISLNVKNYVDAVLYVGA